VVDVHVGDDQGTHVLDRKLDFVARRLVVSAGFRALEEAAIDQDGVVGIDLKAVATAGGAVGGAVVEDVQGADGLREAAQERGAPGARILAHRSPFDDASR
jgi:hypothetical protein